MSQFLLDGKIFSGTGWKNASINLLNLIIFRVSRRENLREARAQPPGTEVNSNCIVIIIVL